MVQIQLQISNPFHLRFFFLRPLELGRRKRGPWRWREGVQGGWVDQHTAQSKHKREREREKFEEELCGRSQ